LPSSEPDGRPRTFSSFRSASGLWGRSPGGSWGNGTGPCPPCEELAGGEDPEPAALPLPELAEGLLEGLVELARAVATLFVVVARAGGVQYLSAADGVVPFGHTDG
jgi:hypothetical protein